jgi:hypothetical protein
MMLIPMIDNIRYLNLHVLRLKAELIDHEYFETISLKTIILAIFDDIVVCPLSHRTRLDTMMVHDNIRLDK